MNKKLSILFCILIFVFFWCGCASVMPISYQNSISPVENGLLKAKTGEERYQILLKTHRQAIEKGVMVDYRGLQSIDITIPENAVSIPLGPVNDFANVVFNVTNNSKELFLFSYTNKAETVAVSGKSIDRGVFRSIPQLSTGKKLLVIEDKNPWVENRKSYSYGHQRKDILLLENGVAENQTVMPYDNSQSSPVGKYYDVVYPYFLFSGLTLNRKPCSTAKTYLCRVIGMDDVRIKNVKINTPQSDLVSDVAINIIDCTNVSFDNVTINGTYSRTDHSGYGISMNNVWNFHASKLFATGNWGVFGNNNINTAFIEDSEINRFDIHCYGRDVTFKNVTFVNLYNQFSSTFGSIQFDKCTFKHFIPVLYETSYNAYAPHYVVFNKCSFYLDSKRNYLISAGKLSPEVNARTELEEKNWPNISINKMTVYVEDNTDQFYLFYCSLDKQFKGSVHSMESININGLTFKYVNAPIPMKIDLANKEIKTDKTLEIKINRVVAAPNSEMSLPFKNKSGRNEVSIHRSTFINITNN